MFSKVISISELNRLNMKFQTEILSRLIHPMQQYNQNWMYIIYIENRSIVFACRSVGGPPKQEVIDLCESSRRDIPDSEHCAINYSDSVLNSRVHQSIH